MKFAREKNLPELKYHVLPRTRGFTMIMQGAKGKSKRLPARSMSTLAGACCSTCRLQLHARFREGQRSADVPHSAQRSSVQSSTVHQVSERCRATETVHCGCRRHPGAEIPYDDETKCADWLHKLFQEKVSWMFVGVAKELSPCSYRIASTNTSSNTIPSPVSVHLRHHSPETTGICSFNGSGC